MKRSAWLSAVALSASLCTGAVAQVTGTVKLDGKPPERKELPGAKANPQCAAAHKGPILDESIVADAQGNLANAVVFLSGENVKGEAPKEPVVLDQKGCMYTPHVVSMTVGQPLLAANSDPFLHNVHSLPVVNPPVNFAQPNVRKPGDPHKPIKEPESFKVKCDVHPWMSAWVVALPHPFHTVTGEDGTYEIDTKGLKDGDYTVYVWQEKLANKLMNDKDEFDPSKLPSQKISIKNGKATADFTLKQQAAAADGDKSAKEVLVSTTGKKDDCCENCEAGKAQPKVAQPANAQPANAQPTATAK